MKSAQKSMIELAEAFQEIEVRYKLFEQRLPDGTLYWDIIRYRLYMRVLTKNGIYANLSTALVQTRPPFWKRVIKLFYLLPPIVLNDFRSRKLRKARYKYAVQLTSRFTDDEGKPIDLLMGDITGQLAGNYFAFENFRSAYQNHPAEKKSKYFLYRLEWMHLFAAHRKENWAYINNIIRETFGLVSDWDEFLDQIINEYRVDYRFYKKLFKEVKPKFLFFQFEPKGMIAAANDLGIHTVDQLHGHANNLIMTYTYPQNLQLYQAPSITKTLFTLGTYWSQIIDFPYQKLDVGNSYFCISHDDKASQKNGLMIVSARFVHEYLSARTVELARQNPEIIFFYKLHSNQMADKAAIEDYFKENKNVRVVLNELSVKEIMDDCFAIALIQSSVTYQAIQKGLKAFIFKTDYYEASHDVFENPNLFLVDDSEQLTAILRRDVSKPSEGEYIFFEPFHEAVFQKFIA